LRTVDNDINLHRRALSSFCWSSNVGFKWLIYFLSSIFQMYGLDCFKPNVIWTKDQCNG